MGEKTEAAEVIAKSLLEEKARHGASISIAAGGVSVGTVIGYAVAFIAALSSLYVMYKTSREIKLINIRIEKEAKKD